MEDQFKQLLKMYRKQMGAGNRKRTYGANISKIIYPHALENKFKRFINEYMKEFTEEVTNFITLEKLNEMKDELNTDSASRSDGPLNDAWSSLVRKLKNKSLDSFSPDTNVGIENRMIVFQLGLNIGDQNEKQVTKQLKKVVGFEYAPVSNWEREVIDTWAKTNYNLISSLSDEYIKKVNLIVSEGVMAGRDSNSIRKELLRKNKDLSVNRARLIARDQVGKLQGQMTKRRMRDVGLDLYEWVTAGDERVRDSHQIMDGKICRWDNNDVMSDDGENWINRPIDVQGEIPGSAIQCRCSSVPYTREVYQEIDREIEEE